MLKLIKKAVLGALVLQVSDMTLRLKESVRKNIIKVTGITEAQLRKKEDDRQPTFRMNKEGKLEFAFMIELPKWGLTMFEPEEYEEVE